MMPGPIPSPFYRVSVKAVIFDEHCRLLVIRDRDGGWEVPGGGWEHGETLTACVRRELLEELGVELDSIDESLIVPCAGPGRHYQRLKLAVPVTLTNHNFTLGDGMQEARFVTASELAVLTFHNGDDVLVSQLEPLWPRSDRAS